MPKLDLSNWGPVTVLLIVIVAIAAAAGAVICIVHPETLTFEALLNDLEKFAIGLGLLGVGRGVATAGKHVAAAQAAVPLSRAAASVPDHGDDSVVADLTPVGNIDSDQGDAGHA